MSKSWLITGGSSGLGLALGRAVLQKGALAILTTRDVAKAREGAPDVEKNGGQWLQLDFATPDAEQIVKDAARRWDVDVLVNNAGFAALGAVEECSPDFIREQYEANFVGPVRLIQAITPIFRERKVGTIANIGSSVSYAGFATTALYASSKSALRTITEGLTAELAPFGIRVLLFEPGRFRTNFGGGVRRAVGGPGFSEVYKGTPVENVFGFLGSGSLSPGNPDEASLRIYEVVTRTGMAAGEDVKNCSRFPLGADANANAEKAGSDWLQMAKATAAISSATAFKE